VISVDIRLDTEAFRAAADAATRSLRKAVKAATVSFFSLAASPGWNKYHMHGEWRLRTANKAYDRSVRNQPGPWAQRLPYYGMGGGTNRKRNKHGRTGCPKQSRRY
jgi:hypothetical protein